tara:strand:+ start:38 stop:577 length:540 start_codon:yes stop_codon:yes gene_type:complete
MNSGKTFKIVGFIILLLIAVSAIVAIVHFASSQPDDPDDSDESDDPGSESESDDPCDDFIGSDDVGDYVVVAIEGNWGYTSGDHTTAYLSCDNAAVTFKQIDLSKAVLVKMYEGQRISDMKPGKPTGVLKPVVYKDVKKLYDTSCTLRVATYKGYTKSSLANLKLDMKKTVSLGSGCSA